MARAKDPADTDDFGTPAYSVLDNAGFGFSQVLLDSAAEQTQGGDSTDEEKKKADESHRQRWMGVHQGERQTGTGVVPGQGDAEAGMFEPDNDERRR
ncbi:MAG TPA: hypothetical protein VIL32_08550 [Steroidobacteraceae bacterium]